MPGIDIAHLERQREWIQRTFGPQRPAGVLDHCRKELDEIEENPYDLDEWIDLAALAFSGALRTGAEPWQIIAAFKANQAENESRTWPDWRIVNPDKAIEHDRTLDWIEPVDDIP